MFTGLLLKESLENDSVLDLIRITRIETWDVDNAALFQPKIWTAIYFEGDESEIDYIVLELSQSLKPQAWYINVSTKDDAYVIFPNKVFKYTQGDKQKEKEAIEYGRSIGIPDRQLDWGE
jgi:hypothetical protein